MLTRAKIGKDADLNNNNVMVAAPVSLLLFGVMAYVLMKGFSDDTLPTDAPTQSTATISDLIFKPYLLPFWALSFVLLAAVIGAIVLARKD
jgi:NADH-quinone oxidoreductase subunit J